MANLPSKTKHKELIQSYIFTTAKYDFNVYEKRLLFKLVEMTQDPTGYNIGTAWQNYKTIELPIKDLLPEQSDKNYDYAKEALDKLSDKKFYFENGDRWEKIFLIVKPLIKRGTMYFEVNPTVWQCIADFSKGWRKYDLEIAMKLKSIYSMRFFELFSKQKEPITFSLSQLREMFQTGDKYKNGNDFVKRIILQANKELDKVANYSFDYEVLKTGAKITAIKFYPKSMVPDNNIIGLSWDLNQKVIDYLKKQIGFTTQEIKANRELFIKSQQLPDVLGTLAILNGKSREKNNPKGWIIAALKNMSNILG